MRNHTWGYLLIALILLAAFGCSSTKSQSPVAPSDDNIPVVEKDNGHSVIMTGTFEIDPVNGEIRDVPDRNPEFHYNLTGFIGSNFKYFITGWHPPNVTVRLQLTNPTAIQAYDVRIIFINLYGKTVMNPDGYTNYLDPPGGADRNPFIYFAKEYDHHKFPVGPGAVDDEILELYYPGGAQPYVTYRIECCLGGNADEPYKMDSFAASGSITPAGGAKVFTVTIYDWQNDITSVKILANDFYPQDLPCYKFRDTNSYIGNLMNKNGVTAGAHTIWIKAESNSPAGIALWMPFTVNVTDTGDEAPNFGALPFSTRDQVTKGLFTYLNSSAEDPEGEDIDYSWAQASPASPAGVFSGTGGRLVPYARWDPPQVANDTQFLFTIDATEHVSGKIAKAVVALTDQEPLPPVITEEGRMYPNPLDETHDGQFGVQAADPIIPSEYAPFKYLWEQISPASPQGTWIGTSNGAGQYPVWTAPSVDSTTTFTFKVTITKDWVTPALITTQDVIFVVNNTD